MDAPFFNRELSWLDFNQRVMNEAARRDLPLLERIKFLAITASNLDEFFMVRVGGLAVLQKAGKRPRDAAGFTPAQQLRLIRQKVKALMTEQYTLLAEEIEPGLRQHGIRQLNVKQLGPSQLDYVANYFDQSLYPVLTPLAVGETESGPVIPNLRIGLMLSLKPRSESAAKEARLPQAAKLVARGRQEREDRVSEPYRRVILPIPQNVPRFLLVPGGDGFSYVLLEDLIAHFCEQLFPGERIHEAGMFRITRNADITLEDEGAYDLAREMEDTLAERKRGDVVRLEVNAGRLVTSELARVFGVNSTEIYATNGPMALAGFMELGSIPGFDSLKARQWEPQPSPHRRMGESIFETLDRQDMLLYHPYDSYDPVLALVEEAANDPNVVAIKQILYRTAKHSRVISALIKAAELGKQVTVVVELKARFEEQRNLERADDLERAGVQLIYGMAGLKTHAKVCVVVRRERGIVKRYIHLGTGNYNESTAKLYTDISYLTARPEFGIEASAFFNALTGGSRLEPGDFLTAAPFFLRDKILELIESETRRAQQGQEARIVIKVNSIQDREVIVALYRASKAGVKIALNIRGICCLIPGLAKISKHISVVSIIDRYLEHARIFYFHQGGDPEVYFSSADLMERNLDRRVELFVQVREPALVLEMTRILNDHFDDDCQAYDLHSDGNYVRRRPKGGKPKRAQRLFQKEATVRARAASRSLEAGLVPHRPRRTLDAG
jgi:polyphosphate kinase